jgi:hypothetical protein
MPFPVSDSLLKRAEQAMGRSLPAALRARLERSNGGDVSAAGDVWTLVPVRDDTDRKRLARTANDILRESREASKWPDFPEGAFVVAQNGTGDLLVLLRSSDEVHLWNHETGRAATVTVDWG